MKYLTRFLAWSKSPDGQWWWQIGLLTSASWFMWSAFGWKAAYAAWLYGVYLLPPRAWYHHMASSPTPYITIEIGKQKSIAYHTPKDVC